MRIPLSTWIAEFINHVPVCFVRRTAPIIFPCTVRPGRASLVLNSKRPSKPKTYCGRNDGVYLHSAANVNTQSSPAVCFQPWKMRAEDKRVRTARTLYAVPQTPRHAYRRQFRLQHNLMAASVRCAPVRSRWFGRSTGDVYQGRTAACII